MDIVTRNKKYGQGRTYVKNKTKLPLNFDIHTLNLMCEFILTENRYIKRSAYMNLRNLIALLDMEKYISDQEKYKRILFIKKGIEARLEKGLTKTITIIKYINGGFIDSDLIDISSFTGLTNEEIDWINTTVSNTLSHTFLYEEAAQGIDLLTRFLAADSTDITTLGKKVEEWIALVNTMFRKNRTESVVTETFSLRDGILQEKLQDIQNELNSDYRKLLTGMQGVNQVTGGGFENTRCYLFLGVTGVGKSLSLLNIAYQIKKYNRNFKPKDPTKIPCIVYLTMENTVSETVDRLVKMSTGVDLRDYPVDELVNMMHKNGELYLTDENPIDIIIKYKPNRSVDTSYLYTVVEDLEDEGYECICMIQDHVKRIRAASGQPDVRMELGDTINELKTFAILKNIPVLTVSHLNRDGARVIDNNTPGRTKADLTRLLGKSNVGESLLMLDNVDLACILNRESDASGKEYMVFKTIKKRIYTLRDYVCQPFNMENGLQLLEDFYSPVPVFKDSLYDTSLQQVAEGTRVKTSGYSATNHEVYQEEPNVFQYAEAVENIQRGHIGRYSSNNIGIEELEKDQFEIAPQPSMEQQISNIVQMPVHQQPVVQEKKPLIRLFQKIS